MKYLCRRQHLLSISICWIVWKLFDHINKIRISDEKTFSFGPGKVFHDRESETWVYWGDLSVSAPVSWLFHNDQSSLDDGSFAPCLLQHPPPSVEVRSEGWGWRGRWRLSSCVVVAVWRATACWASEPVLLLPLTLSPARDVNATVWSETATTRLRLSQWHTPLSSFY